jgi:RNA recognition motif-containing protein
MVKPAWLVKQERDGAGLAQLTGTAVSASSAPHGLQQDFKRSRSRSPSPHRNNAPLSSSSSALRPPQGTHYAPPYPYAPASYSQTDSYAAYQPQQHQQYSNAPRAAPPPESIPSAFRRVYVGGTESATGPELKDFFNKLINERLGTPGKDNVTGAFVKEEKNFTFMEFSTPELATAFCNLGTMPFKGRNLKFQRPKDYDAARAPRPLGPVPDLDVGDSANKLYIAGLSATHSEEDVRKILTEFGAVKYMNIARDAQKNSKGFGFFEYVDPSVTRKAIEGLDGFPLGDKKLQVRLADKAPSVVAPASAPAPPSGLAGLDYSRLTANLGAILSTTVAASQQQQQQQQQQQRAALQYGAPPAQYQPPRPGFAPGSYAPSPAPEPPPAPH